ncbi:MAG TPA: thiamine-phosphate kinase [Casimicrobiaceae bacterium]|nr:thiamine-phosphate kinase [Casimicrobiaceae bacterium]
MRRAAHPDRRLMGTLGEFELIERFFRRRTQHTVLGVGDDAALIAPTQGCEMAVSVDMLVAGRHFFADVEPEALGHKVLAVNLSDLAAMGATPRWALLAGALPDSDQNWLAAFARGFFALADAYGVDLVGGDTTRGPLNLCVTIIGEVPAGEALRRSGARPGDLVYVSGRLGDAALAVAHHRRRIALDRSELKQCEAAMLRPTPRVALGERLRAIASGAIDLSDGLTGDLGHILDASGVGARLEFAAVPRSAAIDRRLAGTERSLALECLLAGGDDYELCFTAAEGRAAEIHALAKTLRLPLTRIGSIEKRRGLVILDEQGRALPSLPRAFDHFAS